MPRGLELVRSELPPVGRRHASTRGPGPAFTTARRCSLNTEHPHHRCDAARPRRRGRRRRARGGGSRQALRRAVDQPIEPDRRTPRRSWPGGDDRGAVTVRDWPRATTQAGDAPARPARVGWAATVSRDEHGLDGHRPRVDSRGWMPTSTTSAKLTPVLAALCALADGAALPPRDRAHPRRHQTDRIAGLLPPSFAGWART